jgi:hypothetical protein
MNFYPQSEQLTTAPDLALMLEQFRANLPAMLEKAELKAAQTSDALLTETWKRLIGPAWRLVATLQLEILTSTYVYQPGQHAHTTLKDLAALIGVSERTLQRWVSKKYKGAKYLRVWLSWRTQYMRREDDLPCKSGTIFRLNLEPNPTHDLTPARNVKLEALKAPWRLIEDLPANQPSLKAEEALEPSELESAQALECESDTAETTIFPVFMNSRHEKTGVKTFPQGREGFKTKIRVEGRDVNLATDALISNSRHDSSQLEELRKAQVMARLSCSSVHHTEALAKAESVAARLNDKHSTVFWYKQFRQALTTGKGEGAIWAAVSNALEARDRGLVRGRTGAYAVGVLNRAVGRGLSGQDDLYSSPALA